MNSKRHLLSILGGQLLITWPHILEGVSSMIESAAKWMYVHTCTYLQYEHSHVCTSMEEIDTCVEHTHTCTHTQVLPSLPFLPPPLPHHPITGVVQACCLIQQLTVLHLLTQPLPEQVLQKNKLRNKICSSLSFHTWALFKLVAQTSK